MHLRSSKKGIRVPLDQDYTLNMTDLVIMNGRSVTIVSLFTGCKFIINNKETNVISLKSHKKIMSLIKKGDLIEVKDWKPSIKV